jgi:hypothetical protein
VSGSQVAQEVIHNQVMALQIFWQPGRINAQVQVNE